MCVVNGRSSWKFVTRFDDCPKLRLQDLTKKDVLFVITCSPIEQFFDDLTKVEKAQWQSQISNRAEGVFLWVRLVTKSLSNGRLEDDEY